VRETAAELAELLRASFSRVEVRGIAGDAQVEAYEAARRRHVARLLRLDPLGLRRWVPAPVVQWAFARLARLVRRRLAHDAGLVAAIRPESFREVERPDGALDLLALCVR